VTVMTNRESLAQEVLGESRAAIRVLRHLVEQLESFTEGLEEEIQLQVQRETDDDDSGAREPTQ